MRLSVIPQLAAAAAVALVPVAASAAPIRAASALPARGSAAMPVRAATPVTDRSQLIGFPIFAFIGIFGAIGLITIIVSGPRRSPG